MGDSAQRRTVRAEQRRAYSAGPDGLTETPLLHISCHASWKTKDISLIMLQQLNLSHYYYSDADTISVGLLMM